ncbi:hypothetical protein KR49_06435 [Synechococcus sp. KORDI-49]|nr:hypothetical protein KR49_06435 [Synechococcus sp. KORDI-49]
MMFLLILRFSKLFLTMSFILVQVKLSIILPKNLIVWTLLL